MIRKRTYLDPYNRPTQKAVLSGPLEIERPPLPEVCCCFFLSRLVKRQSVRKAVSNLQQVSRFEQCRKPTLRLVQEGQKTADHLQIPNSQSLLFYQKFFLCIGKQNSLSFSVSYLHNRSTLFQSRFPSVFRSTHSFFCAFQHISRSTFITNSNSDLNR